jgi:phenylalanyl-tRNA synthetase beta chain
MKSVLAPIGIAAGGDDSLAVTVPWWRTDLTGEVDIIEEVARAIGYGDIEERRGVAAPQAVDDALYEQEDELARSCAALGYREIVSIALQGSRTVGAWERSGLPFWSGLATVVNPLSDDQRFLRPSLLPGVLSAATRVWPRADGRLKLFEIGHIFRNPGSEPESRVAASGEDGAYADNGAIEWPSLCGLAAFGDIGDAGALDRRLLELKGDAEWLVSRFTPSRVETIPEPRAYFHPGAAGNLVVSDRTVAKFGRIHPSLARAYELPEATYAFFLYMENLPRMRPVRPFAALPKFPGTRRDLALVVGEEVAAGQLMQAIRAANVPAFEDVRAFDEYVGPQVENGKKSVALAVMLRRMDATITDAEADASVNALAEMLREKFDAVVRGPALA